MLSFDNAMIISEYMSCYDYRELVHVSKKMSGILNHNSKFIVNVDKACEYNAFVGNYYYGKTNDEVWPITAKKVKIYVCVDYPLFWNNIENLDDLIHLDIVCEDMSIVINICQISEHFSKLEYLRICNCTLVCNNINDNIMLPKTLKTFIVAKCVGIKNDAFDDFVLPKGIEKVSLNYDSFYMGYYINSFRLFDYESHSAVIKKSIMNKVNIKSIDMKNFADDFVVPSSVRSVRLFNGSDKIGTIILPEHLDLLYLNYCTTEVMDKIKMPSSIGILKMSINDVYALSDDYSYNSVMKNNQNVRVRVLHVYEDVGIIPRNNVMDDRKRMCVYPSGITELVVDGFVGLILNLPDTLRVLKMRSVSVVIGKFPNFLREYVNYSRDGNIYICDLPDSVSIIKVCWSNNVKLLKLPKSIKKLYVYYDSKDNMNNLSDFASTNKISNMNMCNIDIYDDEFDMKVFVLPKVWPYNINHLCFVKNITYEKSAYMRNNNVIICYDIIKYNL